MGTRVRDIRVCRGPALMLATFGVVITAAVVGGSGYLAVYLCGVVLMDRVSGLRREELNITHGSLAWLSQILMFLMLVMVVIASLMLQGWTIPWLARRLDLEDKREVPTSESLERRQS
nr:hypothetical protein [Thiocapsa sp.]